MKPCLPRAKAALLSLLCIAACQGKEAVPTDSRKPSSLAVKGADPAVEQLSALDPRAPVPLQPMMAWHQKQNMMQHLVVVQRITDGLAREDWEEVAAASALIESSPQMQQMCEHMGAGAQGFAERALDFHHRALAIGEAARAHDAAAVLRATSYTLQACTGCHAAFRQELVTAEEWEQRTGQSHDPWEMHGAH